MKKCDRLWGELIHRRDVCEVGEAACKALLTDEWFQCAGPFNAHHLISRGHKATRHRIENGIRLCAKHHIFSNRLSAHGAPLAFAEFLEKYLPEKWSWVRENKFKIEKAPDYEDVYKRLILLGNKIA